MSRTLFISDLHLDTSRPAVTRALGGFLAANTHCDALYILGDLFEAWPGDDEDSPLAREVTALLRNFSKAGPRLFIMRGNRDFLLGTTFCRAVDAALLSDPTLIDLYGTPTLLMHGDSLCTADKDYQAFRKTARDPAWQAQILAQSLEERRELASHLRGMSRDANASKAEDIMDVSPAEVEKVMTDHGVARLIHGHTHRPARHNLLSGTRWVLGDWETRGWVIEADNAGINLTNFII